MLETNNTKPANQDPAHPEDERGSEDVSTFLVIPYFSGDQGRPGVDRPLSGSVVSWLCSSIVVNGQPGVNTFKRGVPTSVTVSVSNWGNGTAAAPVQVSLWWADPSLGFTKPTMFGQGALPVPTGGGVYTTQSPIVGTIPITAPAHVCLLARVTSPLDVPAAGTPISPGIDRHWAQLNINAITTTMGQPFQFMFWVGNPLAKAATFDVVARPVTGEALAVLNRVTRTDHLALERVPKLEVMDLRNRRRDERGARTQVTLEPGQRRPFHVVGQLPRNVEPGRSVAFEVVQVGRDERTHERIYGAIGLVVNVVKPP